jgi:HSP20 family protein
MSEKATAVQTAPERILLSLVEPESLLERLDRIHQAIARRAFEIFEGDGSVSGRELENWFKAESELLHPVHVQVSETDTAVELQAEVPGFGPKELDVSVQPKQVTISGKRETTTERKEGKTVYEESSSNEILRVIDLPAGVDSTKTVATLKNGILSLKAPKAIEAKATTKVEVKAAA